jgi:8-oxo-dGTP pyrophosphatase MutT (NUDIX family)
VEGQSRLSGISPEGDESNVDSVTIFDVIKALTGYTARDATEVADLARIVDLLDHSDDPWSRATRLHLTGSAVIVHPPTERVLLRWHERQQAWLQVGGHADPGESDPLEVARRESVEETGLTDLVPWPDGALVHIAIVPVPAKDDDPAHEHADLRYVLATDSPDSARPERPGAPVRWFSLPEATEVTTEDNLRRTLIRVEQLFRP